MTTPGIRANGREAALVQPAPPDIDEATAARIARDGWGVTGRARALGSHQDRNFLIEPEGAPRVLLKIANPSVSAGELEAQSAAAAAITAAGVRAPRALPFADGTTARAVVVDGVTMQARLLEFLEGETLSGYLSPGAVRAIGALAATVDVALADLDRAGRRARAPVGPARSAGRARRTPALRPRRGSAGRADGRRRVGVGCRVRA